MRPEKALPHSEEFADADSYVDSLLDLIASSHLLRILCGGVHILDFFTSDPDLYSEVLPLEWRLFFAQHEIMDLIKLFVHEDLNTVASFDENDPKAKWKGGERPPSSLLDYLKNVRKHLLNRKHSAGRDIDPRRKLARHVAVGMNVKKVYEVGFFASFLNDLASNISETSAHSISHLVDFGSGQNYLGRALASEPYNRHIVAIESKSANAERARQFDVSAKLAPKKKIMVNKKVFRAGFDGRMESQDLPTPPPEPVGETDSEILAKQARGEIEVSKDGIGTIQYVEHRITDGDLSDVIESIPAAAEKNLMIMSLHSCGNLVHHGLRSMMLNPAVKAVAMVGCCYNLLTERLGPASYKLPELRPATREHPRKTREGNAYDPHGFPMSRRLCEYRGEGIRFNITARSMAVQAPQNWGESDSESFFTRHFYRALLQRVFLDRGVVGPPTPECVGGGSAASDSSSGTPIIIGSLRKGCYENFVAYVRGALAKLTADGESAAVFREKMKGITDAEIAGYEDEYRGKKKELSVIWTLMALSAGLIEATIVVDRWVWLREQEEVAQAWVEPAFGYMESPRNLVVVGIKK